MPTNILLTGKNGQVGWELQRTLQPLGRVVALDRQGMDLANPDSIRAAIREIRPNLIINAAAYTTVDKAETEPDLAMAINGVAPGIMAEEAKKIGALLIHCSTDYVFDGSKTTPYVEEDAAIPISTYGRTKLAGELAVKAIAAPHFILRNSWVYSERGKNFLLMILRLAKERNELRIVDDQIGAPTWSRTIAEAIAYMLVHGIGAAGIDQDWTAEKAGIYHICANGEASWFTFTKKILALASDKIPSELTVTPITTADYPLPAKRPASSRLSLKKFEQSFGFVFPEWSDALKRCLDEMRSP